MIGQLITDDKGQPIDQKKLSESTYQPPEEVMKLFARCQRDYQVAWALQHRDFDEFDGISLLQRARLDQQTFGAFVGAEYVPQHKRWRWRGRKNTSRNKLITIASHMLVGILYPYITARNEDDEEDKMTARVMKILVEEHLKKAKYEIKFLYILLSALVNPAVFIEVEWIDAIQRVKQKMSDGKIQIIEAVDHLLSGLNLHIIPIDEVLLADFFTGPIQAQPYIVRARRISYDMARSKYSGKYFNKEGEDLFNFVEAGKTRVVLAGQENQTLFDIEWTEADRDFVQELTFFYRGEDLEATFVGGVFMGELEDVYNSNPFEHRRLSLVGDKWISVPVYPMAKSGFEPIDPTGRFAYFKSGAFKLYWDDLGSNTMDRIMMDGTYLDVFKPTFLSGVAKADATVIYPGATIGMPQGATMTPYQLGPNLAAAINALKEREANMSDSTVDPILQGQNDPNTTAYATAQAQQNARVFFGIFGLMTADLIEQVGGLTIDCIVNHVTVGDLDASVPESLAMKFRTILAKGKEKGKNVTHKIVLTDKYIGRTLTPKQKRKREWELFEKEGGIDSDQRIWEVNPYQFARHVFTLTVDADQIVKRSAGLDKQDKVTDFNMMTDPRVAPYTDQEAVVNDFVIEEFGGDDPDRYKKKGGGKNAMLNAIMGNNGGPAQPGQPNQPGQPMQKSPMQQKNAGGVVVPPVAPTQP